MTSVKNIFRILLPGLLFWVIMLNAPPAGAKGQVCIKGESAQLNALPGILQWIHPVLDSYGQIQQSTVGRTIKVQNLSFFQKIRQRYETAGIRAFILLIVLAYLIISLATLLLIIMATRAYKSSRRKKAEKIRGIYQEELTHFLFGEDEPAKEFTAISNPFNRDIFTHELLSLHNNLHGETALRLRDLYFNLNLYKDSMARVSQRRWDIKARGFREVAQMDVKDAIDEVASHINSKNAVLRTEAQVTMVKLTEDDPLGFLDKLQHELSLWEQVNIVNALEYHQIVIDSFKRWFTSANESVVAFAAKMSGVFKHSHVAADLALLMQHQNPLIRHAAIEALGKLEMPEYLDMLIDSYNREKPVEPSKEDALLHIQVNHNRKAAIKAICQLATDREVDFLAKVLEREKDFEILLLTVSTLFSLKPQGLVKLNVVYENADPQIRRIIENVNQNQIQ